MIASGARPSGKPPPNPLRLLRPARMASDAGSHADAEASLCPSSTPAPFVYAPYTSAESVARRFSFTSRPLLFEKVLTIKSDAWRPCVSVGSPSFFALAVPVHYTSPARNSSPARPNGHEAPVRVHVRVMDLGMNLVGSTRALTARPKEPPKAVVSRPGSALNAGRPQSGRLRPAAARALAAAAHANRPASTHAGRPQPPAKPTPPPKPLELELPTCSFATTLEPLVHLLQPLLKGSKTKDG